MGGIGHILTKALGYTKRGLNVYGPTVFGQGTEKMGQAFKKSMTTKNPFKGQYYKDIWAGTKAAGKAAEKLAASEKAIHGNFFKSSWNSIRNLPAKLGNGCKAGARAARMAGKNRVLGGIKGLGRTVGKSMPLIGSLMLVAFELPNIIKATANEGIVQGAAETVKAGARLAGGTFGAVVGQALIPIPVVGSLVGWIAGEFIAGKLVGKSYSERKEAAKLAEQTAQQQETQQQYPDIAGNSTNPYQASNTNYLQQMMLYQQMMNGNKYEDDLMTQIYMNGLKQQPPLDYNA